MELQETRYGRNRVDFKLVLWTKTTETHSLVSQDERVRLLLRETADRPLAMLVELSDTTPVE